MSSISQQINSRVLCRLYWNGGISKENSIYWELDLVELSLEFIISKNKENLFLNCPSAPTKQRLYGKLKSCGSARALV